MLTALARLPRAAWARAGRRGADAGITLVELVVTMSLMSIVSALALTWLVGTTNSNTATAESGFSAAGARTAVQSWVSLLQVATPPSTPTNRALAITPTSITFTADTGATPTCTAVCSPYATSQVVIAMTAPVTVGTVTTYKVTQTITPSGGTAGSPQVQFAGGVAAPSGCLFTPYTAAGTPLPCTGLTITQLGSVARVGIWFTVQPTQGGVQTYRTSVAVPGNVS